MIKGASQPNRGIADSWACCDLMPNGAWDEPHCDLKHGLIGNVCFSAHLSLSECLRVDMNCNFPCETLSKKNSVGWSPGSLAAPHRLSPPPHGQSRLLGWFKSSDDYSVDKILHSRPFFNSHPFRSTVVGDNELFPVHTLS